MSACVYVRACKDVVKSRDDEDNVWHYGLMSGSLAHIYAIYVTVLGDSQAAFRMGRKVEKNRNK